MADWHSEPQIPPECLLDGIAFLIGIEVREIYRTVFLAPMTPKRPYSD